MFSQQVIINDQLPYTQASLVLNQTVIGTDWTANAASDVVVYYTPFGDSPDDATQQLTSNQFSVAFIGSQQQVQVTLVTPAALGDIATVIRNTPADRLNLYTNTNFTPTMLNQDFGILTLVDQQAQLVNQLVGPRYNYSATIVPVTDTILPILLANQLWAKNSADTAIIALDVPASGFAPANGTYVLLTPNSALPSAQALSAFGTSGLLAFNSNTGLIVETSVVGTNNQLNVVNGSGIGGNIGISIVNNPILPGTAGMGIPEGTTAQRVIPGSNIALRYNTSLLAIEFWNGTTWEQIGGSEVNPGLINELAWYAASGNTLSGLPTVSAGVLTTVSNVPTWAAELSLALGGTNASLTASDGGIFYSTATAGAILAGTGTPNQALLSGLNAAPAWSTATYPATTTANQLLFSSATNTIAGLATANYGVLITSSAGVPSWLANGTTGQVFTATTGSPPSWAAPAASSITFTGDSGTPFSGAAVTVTGGTTGLNFIAGTPNLTLGGTLAVTNGGTSKTAVTTAPSPTAWAGWDANKNLSANAFIPGYTTTATAAGTTTLVVGSTFLQYFTGSTTQTVQMPVTSTLVLGEQWRIVNLSSGNVTVTSSGGNTIQVMAGGSNALLTVISITGTTAASWDVDYTFNTSPGSGTVNVGSTNQLAWYAANGNAVSGLATTNNGVLVTSAGGVPSISTTLPNGLAMGTPASITLTNATGLPIGGLTGLGTGVATALAANVNGSGAISLATSPTFVTPTLGAATATSLAFSPTTGGIVGTTTNNNAAAGSVGEVISSTVLAASAVALTTGVAANVTSISLTAGDWDVSGVIGYIGGGGCNIAYAISAIGTTSTGLGDQSQWTMTGPNNPAAATNIGSSIFTRRISLSTTTTIYLVAQSSFSVGSLSAGGYIQGRRVR